MSPTKIAKKPFLIDSAPNEGPIISVCSNFNDAGKAPAKGIYFLRLKVDDFERTEKIVLAQ